MAQSAADNWQVSEVSGKAVVIRDGQSVPATRGTIVPPGAIVATEAGSRAIVVRGHDFVSISPNSRVHVPAGAERQGLVQMVQDWGNAIFRIEKLGVPHFGVRTPYLAAVVKGTTFSITVTATGASLQVVEGVVETSTLDGGASDLIRPGVVASVNAGDPFRMSVQGQDLRQFDSPQRGTARAVPGAGAATQASAGTEAVVSVATSTTGAAPAQEAPVIAAGIQASAPDLGRLTRGVVKSGGDDSARALVAANRTSEAGAAARTENTSEAGAATAGAAATASAASAATGENETAELARAVSTAASVSRHSRESETHFEAGSANGGSGSGSSGNGSRNDSSGVSNASGTINPATGSSGSSGSGNGNSGSSNAGGNNAGDGNSGSSNAGGNGSGNGNSGSSNAGGNGSGNGNSGSSNASGNSAGNGNSGSSNAGGNSAGNGNSGSSNAGGNSAGNGNPKG